VHLSADDRKAERFFAPHGMTDLPRISDPAGKLYEAFGLTRADWRQYINFESILRTLTASLKGHWAGLPAGDVQRMPGVFLIVNGEILKSFRHKRVSDRPDYLRLATLDQTK
jgi:hypothetical protein